MFRHARISGLFIVSRLVVALFAMITLYSCKNDGYEYQKVEGAAQGTTYVITYGSKGKLDFKRSADSIFNVIDHSMSLWDSTSIISNFNKNTSSQEVDEHFRNVLLKSYEVYQLSGGAFDPSVGPLTKAWSFIRKNDLPLPSDETIDSLKTLIGLEKISLEGHEVTKQVPAIQLDFNAIAQGYTVDVLAGHLEKLGVENYLIELGGELRAKGTNKEGKVWSVGVEKPVDNETEEQNDLQLVIALDNKGVATSGNYRNFIQKEGAHLSHILNPETGRPVEENVVSVTVVAATGMEADAWGTAFLVLGKERSVALAQKLGLEFQMVSVVKNEFEVFQTEGFKKMIQ